MMMISKAIQRKYNYMRAEQLNKTDNGVNLMPNTTTPQLPTWGKDKALPPEIQQRLDEMDKETSKTPAEAVAEGQN